jgi:hypothetical protein
MDCTIGALTSHNFRHKISGGSNNAVKHVFSAFDMYGSVEVDDRQAATVSGKEDIWRLQIQVCHAMLMHEVNSLATGHRYALGLYKLIRWLLAIGIDITLPPCTGQIWTGQMV